MQDGNCYCEFGDFGPALDREDDWYEGSVFQYEDDDHYADQDEDQSRCLLEILA